MNKLATIQRIHSIQQHPNADTLSVAKGIGVAGSHKKRPI